MLQGAGEAPLTSKNRNYDLVQKSSQIYIKEQNKQRNMSRPRQLFPIYLNLNKK